MLRQIVNRTGAAIILCSSWKENWERIHKDDEDVYAKYLDNKLRKEGIRILDKTDDDNKNRGTGIQRYLKNHPLIKSWCVIDDEIFPDYEECLIMDHLVETSFSKNGGLHKEHVEQAIKILNGE